MARATPSILLLFCYAFACNTCELDDAAMLQAKTAHPLGPTEAVADARDLATVVPPDPMVLKEKNIKLNFLSAVPTFGPENNYIALLHRYDDTLWDALGNYTLFCSGPNRSHRVPMRILGGETLAHYKRVLVWHCDWPREEASAGCYNMFVEEASGRELGHVHTCYKPNLLQHYSTAACVTSVWQDPKTGYNGFLRLPQWIEFNLLHGVKHFLFYTMTGTDPRTIEVFRPYLKAGLATRVHLDISQASDHKHNPIGYSTQSWIINDCLYRMKGHADWLYPTIDTDEYLFTTANKTADNPFDDIVTDWAAHGNANSTAVHSIHFGIYRFRMPEKDDSQLQISSPMRSLKPQGTCPKYVLKPSLVNALFIHWPTSWVAEASGLGVPRSIAVINHYRTHDKQSTNFTDPTLVSQVPSLGSAIHSRFNASWQGLARTLIRDQNTSPAGFIQNADGIQEAGERWRQRLDEEFSSWVSDFNKIKQTQIIHPPVRQTDSQ